ncbi:hypothetical protein TPDSL_10210 [Terrisporobacter petrolearius]|uniref:hypothetical protein n=1 Tax=Terrisporobacter petrolearius TaxID=1460447 RepID=UPI0033684B66
MNKRLKIGLISSLLIVLPFNSCFAQKQNVDIEPTFTKEDGLWYPGRVESKDFNLINNREENIIVDKLYMKFKSCKDLKTNNTLNVFNKKYREFVKNSTVKLTYKDQVLLEERLENLTLEKGIALNKEIKIEAGKKALLNMTIDMDEKMNNDAQNIESIFKIAVSYKVDGGSGISNPDEELGKDKNNNGNLPQTGSLINGESLLALGSIVVGAGIILNLKKGGKHNE